MRLQKITVLCLVLSLISGCLTACSHVAGNIIPDTGPTMESVYDDLGDPLASVNLSAEYFMGDAPPASSVNAGALAASSGRWAPDSEKSPAFYLLDNPPLKVYVFPHLAGSEMLPIPGYWTAFSAYPRNYYALPLAANEDQR